jgi:hypothetical protein
MLFGGIFEPLAEVLRDGRPYLLEVFQRWLGGSIGEETLVSYFDERRERVFE